MILSQAQAEAVYSAMVALNNIGAEMHDVSGDNFKLRVSRFSGEIDVIGRKLGQRESYPDQMAFAAAYQLSEVV